MDLEIRLFTAFAYWVVFTIGFIAIWPIRPRTLLVHTLLFVVMCSVMVLNAQYDLIEEKAASFISYDMFMGEPLALTFVLQYYVTLPAFWLTENAYSAHSVNLAVQSLCFLIAFRFILHEKPNTLAGLALCLFPAYFNFTIFGLRDPYINLITTLFVAGLINLPKPAMLIMSAGLAILSVFARPEFSMMLVAFGMMRLFLASSRPVKVISASIYVAVLYFGILFMPLAFGITGTGSVTGNIQKIAEFNDMRNERRIGGEGSGSHILGGRLYSLPFVTRYPVQVTASFIAPLPFEIKGAVFLIAFAESLFFTYFAWIAFLRSRGLRNARFLFLCGMLYMMGFAIFAINYGNLLRMRYPAHVFFVGAIACAYHERRNKTGAYRLRNPYRPADALQGVASRSSALTPGATIKQSS